MLREGFETAVFLLGLLQEATLSPGLAIAGGCWPGLSRPRSATASTRAASTSTSREFFRLTGAVLVVVAAGLLMTALRTAHEAGWLDVGQTQALDLTWLVHPGTTWSAMVTGILVITAYPTVVEVDGLGPVRRTDAGVVSGRSVGGRPRHVRAGAGAGAA